MRLTLVATFALAITSQAHASVEEQLQHVPVIPINWTV